VTFPIDYQNLSMPLPPGISLFEHQKLAVEQLRTGSILCGGVGSGKSLTALAYYFLKECEEMSKPKDLYIITTAAKRDTLDWERECALLMLSRDRDASISAIKVTVDSWNNINKYINIIGAFFIFDEQRVVGSGSWVKSFLKIVKSNNWILLSATPGDTWMDYIPTFIANGFYKNRTEFIRNHVSYNTFTKYPKVDHYVEIGKLMHLKNRIIVSMLYSKQTRPHQINIIASFDKDKFELVYKKRWNPFENKPIKDISQYCYTMRRVVNSDPHRIKIVKDLFIKHKKIIVFYNFNYELDLLRGLKEEYSLAEYNGHKHEGIPKTEEWIYLVQYLSGAEGWNCIETNTIVFYSMNYSYRIMTQAAGRIDRLNTPFLDLFYYTIKSESAIDLAISRSLNSKKDFNEIKFLKGV
jgi:hypothetical protein